MATRLNDDNGDAPPLDNRGEKPIIKYLKFQMKVYLMDRPCKTCMSQTCPGFGNPGACAGTLETEAHPDRVTEKQFEDIIAYQLECFHESKAGLPFNERYLLSMIIELREHRELEKKNAMRPIAPPITFTTPKTEITAADIPRGMSAEDVALPEHSCDNCLDTDPDNCIYNICEQERREQEAADTLKVNWEMTARHRGKIAQLLSEEERSEVVRRIEKVPSEK